MELSIANRFPSILSILVNISARSITWSWPSLLHWTSNWVEQRPKAFDAHIDYSLPPMDVVVKKANGTLVKIGYG